MTIGANTIKVFVGGRAIGGTEAGYGGTGGYGISGTQAWINSIQNRGNGISTWGGSIAFDTTQNWFYGLTTAGLTSQKLDFYSVAKHELGHVLGIGTSSQWTSLSSGGSFHGANAMSVYGGPVPLSPDGATGPTVSRSTGNTPASTRRSRMGSGSPGRRWTPRRSAIWVGVPVASVPPASASASAIAPAAR